MRKPGGIGSKIAGLFVQGHGGCASMPYTNRSVLRLGFRAIIFFFYITSRTIKLGCRKSSSFFPRNNNVYGACGFFRGRTAGMAGTRAIGEDERRPRAPRVHTSRDDVPVCRSFVPRRVGVKRVFRYRIYFIVQEVRETRRHF